MPVISTLAPWLKTKKRGDWQKSSLSEFSTQTAEPLGLLSWHTFTHTHRQIHTCILPWVECDLYSQNGWIVGVCVFVCVCVSVWVCMSVCLCESVCVPACVFIGCVCSQNGWADIIKNTHKYFQCFFFFNFRKFKYDRILSKYEARNYTEGQKKRERGIGCIFKRISLFVPVVYFYIIRL